MKLTGSCMGGMEAVTFMEELKEIIERDKRTIEFEE